MHRTIGKVKLVQEGVSTKKIDLWAVFNTSEGYLRVQDVLRALEWDHVFYVDDNGFEIQICAYEHGKLQGFSTDRFKPDQSLNVHGRKFPVGQGSPIGASYNFRTCHRALGQDTEMATSLLHENNDFYRLMTLYDQVATTVMEMKEIMESLSQLSPV